MTVRKLSKGELEWRISEAGAGRYEFVRWVIDGEFGSKKKCVVRCIKDGYEWSAKPNSLVDRGDGCPHCSGKRRWTAEERIGQINELKNIEFTSWVDGYSGKDSKVNVRCTIDGYQWRSTVSSLVNNGCSCPQCAGKRRWTAEERVSHINETNDIEFISWVNGYKNSYSKANVRCKVDLFEWSATVISIVSKGHGCPQCAGVRKWTAEERISHINSLENILFLSWVDGYSGKDSKANVRCKVDGFEWEASVHNMVNNGRGCPYCANRGFQINETGYLYALRSECGRHMKIGISNNPKRRHKELEKRTPFKFNIVEQLEGDGTKIAELEKHFHNKYESAGFKSFDGATEWLVCTPELIEELRGLGDK